MLYNAVVSRVLDDPTLTETEKVKILSLGGICDKELLTLIKLISLNGNNPYVVSVYAYEE